MIGKGSAKRGKENEQQQKQKTISIERGGVYVEA